MEYILAGAVNIVVFAVAYYGAGYLIPKVFGRRLRLKFTDADGVTTSTVIRYKDGDELHGILTGTKNKEQP